ncbi:hypothetical protein ZWY2020_058726 [Hordeum vulgare]|nr:hypothetical protein ZWY2020_058726 [Hordeum vulgare]
MSKFATPPPARNLDMPLVLDDATSAAHDAYDDAMLDTALPLGAFLDAQIARVVATCDDTSETADTFEVEPVILLVRTRSPKYEGLSCLNVNDLKLPSKHASMVTTQVEQVLKAQNDLLNELNDNSVRVVTRGGRMTHEPLYPEGHPKRIEQDSLGVSTDAPSHPRKKKRDDRNLHASNPVTPESPNDVSVSDAETQSGDEHEPNDNIDSDAHEDAQPSNDKDVEFKPVDLDNPQPKNKRYDKNDFAARKHGKEREPWVQKPMPFPPKPSKKKDDEDFERFVEMIRPIFLQMRLTDMLKMSLYAKYMKDIVTNKRRISEVEISTMLANYTFKGGTPKKLVYLYVKTLKILKRLAPRVSGSGQLRTTGGEVVLAGGERPTTTRTAEGIGNSSPTTKHMAETTGRSPLTARRWGKPRAGWRNRRHDELQALKFAIAEVIGNRVKSHEAGLLQRSTLEAGGLRWTDCSPRATATSCLRSPVELGLEEEIDGKLGGKLQAHGSAKVALSLLGRR